MDNIEKKIEVAKLFSEVAQIVKEGMRKSYEDVGLTVPQSMVISTLLKFGDMKITELSRKINLTNSTLSGIVDRLEKQQLVVRKRSDEDRRIVYVQLTPKFEEVYQGIYKRIEENFQELLSPASAEELGKIVEGLKVLKKTLQQER